MNSALQMMTLMQTARRGACGIDLSPSKDDPNRLEISKIEPGSVSARVACLCVGMILVEVDGIQIVHVGRAELEKTLDQVRHK